MPTENILSPASPLAETTSSKSSSSSSLSSSPSPAVGRSGDSTPQQQQQRSPTSRDLRALDLISIGRPRVSVQDIIGTYHALRSGIEIDIIDPIPDWPQKLFPNVISSSSGSLSSADGGSGTQGVSPNVDHGDSLPPHVEKAMAKLQRENLLLRTELNYELWLKRELVKRIGKLYIDRIQVKGAEVERQTLVKKKKKVAVYFSFR